MVFIDTNPTLDIFTEIALVSSTKLVVPVMADDYSTAALCNMIYLLHGVGQSSAPHMQMYEQTLFWSRARENKVALPKIQAVIFNRTACMELKNAEVSLLADQHHVLFSLMNEIEASAHAKLCDVFNLARKPRDAQDTSNKLCCWMM